jgi:hemerythrin
VIFVIGVLKVKLLKLTCSQKETTGGNNMVLTENLLRQHHEILEIAQKICSYQTEQQVADNAFPISLLLGKLAGKISIHLSTEDKFVYPKLMQHQDITIQERSKRFADEMGDLAKTFENYKTRYLAATKISENASFFIGETKQIVAALSARVEKENNLLYPLLNQ